MIATALLWRETRASVETASAALRLAEMSERPWVVVESVSVTPGRADEPGLIIITFTNTGSVPATGGQVRLDAWYAGDFGHVRESVDNAEPRTMWLIAPNQRAQLAFPYERSDGKMRWRAVGPLLIVAGVYLYPDSSGTTRELRFCFSRDGYKIEEGGPWDPCPEHNSST